MLASTISKLQKSARVVFGLKCQAVRITSSTQVFLANTQCPSCVRGIQTKLSQTKWSQGKFETWLACSIWYYSIVCTCCILDKEKKKTNADYLSYETITILKFSYVIQNTLPASKQSREGKSIIYK